MNKLERTIINGIGVGLKHINNRRDFILELCFIDTIGSIELTYEATQYQYDKIAIAEIMIGKEFI